MMSRLVDRVVVGVIAADGVAGRAADFVIDRIPGRVLNGLVNLAPARVAERVAADLRRCDAVCCWRLLAGNDEQAQAEEPD